MAPRSLPPSVGWSLSYNAEGDWESVAVCAASAAKDEVVSWYLMSKEERDH